MCKYCENVDGQHEFEPIIGTVANFGILGEMFVDFSISDSYDGPIMALDGIMKNASKGCIRETKRIRYCPICGEDLQKKWEEMRR